LYNNHASLSVLIVVKPLDDKIGCGAEILNLGSTYARLLSQNITPLPDT